jgi:hypothetical protein
MRTTPETSAADQLPMDHQLELEMQAFAELLLDIYEWRYRNKKRNVPAPIPEPSP